MGVDDVTVPAYLMDVTNSATIQAFVGAQVWGSAYDPVNDRVLFNDGSTLYEWPVGGAVNLLGTIVDPAGATQVMVGLAFYNGQLYGTKNIANEAIWAIDTTPWWPRSSSTTWTPTWTAAASRRRSQHRHVLLHQRRHTPYGTGLMIDQPRRLGHPGRAYPAGQTDIDGLAVSDDGYAYLVIDEPGFIYVYDLVGGAYVAPLTDPWTTSEVFSGGACMVPPAAIRYSRSAHADAAHPRQLDRGGWNRSDVLLRGDQYRHHFADLARPGRQRTGRYPGRLPLHADASASARSSRRPLPISSPQ